MTNGRSAAARISRTARQGLGRRRGQRRLDPRQHRRRGHDAQHVLGQGQHHRAGPALHRGVEGAGDVLGQAVGVVHLGDPLGEAERAGAEHLPVVDFLEGLAVALLARHLADEDDERRRVLEGGVDADRGVARARAAGDEAVPGMYAAFGQVAEAAQRLVTQQWVRYGFLSEQKTVLGVLNDLATNHLLWLVALLLGIYVLRRLLDYVAERTGLRILGLVVVLIEAFFMLLVITGGIRVFQIFRNWLRDRAVLAVACRDPRCGGSLLRDLQDRPAGVGDAGMGILLRPGLADPH